MSAAAVPGGSGKDRKAWARALLLSSATYCRVGFAVPSGFCCASSQVQVSWAGFAVGSWVVDAGETAAARIGIALAAERGSAAPITATRSAAVARLGVTGLPS